MFRRLTVLILSTLVLLTISATAASAAPPAAIGQVPQGFPSELTRFVGGTPGFLDGAWFTDQECKDKGGNVSSYINEVMYQEPRLLYWSMPPAARLKFWGENPPPGAENKEPPGLPKTFPAVHGADNPFRVAFNYCADELKEWTNPAANAWGFTWAAAPDPESVERMKSYAGAGDNTALIKQFTNACADSASPYCQKAFFVDCVRVAMNPEKKERCHRWNDSMANFFAGLQKFISDNTGWLESIGEFLGVLGPPLLAAGKVTVDAFVSVLLKPLKVLKFVVDPADAVDDMANALHKSAVEFTTKVLQGLAGVGNFDPASPWFLQTYAASTGLGLLVMSFMAILMIVRTASGGGGRDDLQEALVKHLPMGMFLAVFSPAIAAVLVEAVNGLTNGIAAWDSQYLTNAVAKLTLLGGITGSVLPGGAVVGVVIFGLMVMGTFAVFVGLVMQSIALPLSGLVAGIAWGMLVHPRWRRKALRPPLAFLGVLLSKPLLFFLLGAIFALIDGNLSEPAMLAGGIPLLTQLTLVICALAIVGFAPFSLLKHAPLLPTAADSHDSQSSPGFGTAAVVGAGVGAMERHQAGRGREQDDDRGGGAQRSIQQTYSQRKQGNQQQQPRTNSPVSGGGKSAGATGSGRTGVGGMAKQQVAGAAVSGGTSTGGTVGSGAVTKAATGTTAGASKAGAASGAAAGLPGLAAQLGVAGVNKARQSAHTRHVPEVDDEATKE